MTTDYAWWLPEDIPPIPLLRELNDWVVKQNEKRLPKWKFRFAPDFAIQVHPRITRAFDVLFECVALQTEGLTATLFVEPNKLRGQQFYRVGFDLRVQADNWSFKARSGRWSRGGTTEQFYEVRRRARDALRPEHFVDLDPGMMLAPACLCCGKGLTDPVSMARWIGPECWGNASTDLPRIFQAKAA